MTTTDTIRLMAAEKEIDRLRKELKEALEILRLLIGEEGRFSAHEAYEGTTRGRSFLKKHEGKDV